MYNFFNKHIYTDNDFVFITLTCLLHYSSCLNSGLIDITGLSNKGSLVSYQNITSKLVSVDTMFFDFTTLYYTLSATLLVSSGQSSLK